MKKQIFTLCAMLLALCSLADAQWIIDGQQVQTLNLNVSDPQALYTDGSREMTAPLSFAPSLTATGGMFRAYIPWTEQTADIFQFNGDDECVKLSADPNVSFQVGGVFMNTSGLAGYGVSVGFEDNTLFGPWKLNQVADNNYALLNRSYADSRYIRADSPATQPLKFAQSLTATNGALNIYATDSEDYLGFFKTLSFQDGLQFCTEGSASMLFGSGNDGLLVGMANIVQLEYGKRINFETGELSGSTGAKEWHVTTDPIDASGIVSKGYADGRYLRSVTNLTAPLTFAGSDVQYGGSGIQGFGNAVSVEEGVLFGDWSLETVLNADEAIITRSFADNRYLRSDTSLTAPLDFDPAYSGAAFKAYAVDDGITVGYFYPRTDENGLRLSGSTSSLLIGDPAEGLNLYASSLYYSGTGARIGFEDRELDGGQWTVTSSPTAAGGIVSKGYADGRYLQRTEGITTNRVIQAGDTLVISNGLITAINP